MPTTSVFLLLLLLPWPTVVAITVLKSKIKVGSDDPDVVSGARLLDGREVDVDELTICIRFNLPVSVPIKANLDSTVP